jgi:hypothetical protein
VSYPRDLRVAQVSRRGRSGKELPISGRISLGGGTLTITGLTQADAGRYTLRYQTGCGTASQDAILAVTSSGCPADFNNSGAKDVQDVFDFLAAWFAACP